MTPERKARLEALEWWVWDTRAALEAAWSTRFDELVAFYEANGRCPPRSTPGGLRTWVGEQRTCHETMCAARKARLESLAWWVWDTRAALEAAWSTKFDELVAFYEANGRLPPQSTPGGLGAWVQKQRSKREAMTPERKARLDDLGWWAWTVIASAQ
jgi:hypothetical protein